MNCGGYKKIAVLLFAGMWLTSLFGCVVVDHDHGPDHYDRVDVVDVNGYHHQGYYDESHDWHGGFYDANHQFHDDPHDWHH
jgi:hypothetical protein